MIQSQSAAVIDIGTNSIKFILAEKRSGNALNILYEETLEVRIGAGISHSSPRLEDTAIEKVSEAIISLLQIKNRYQIEPIRIVATSAVREATNQNCLFETIKDETGIELEILSGESNLPACYFMISNINKHYLRNLSKASLIKIEKKFKKLLTDLIIKHINKHKLNSKNLDIPSLAIYLFHNFSLLNIMKLNKRNKRDFKMIKNSITEKILKSLHNN